MGVSNWRPDQKDEWRNYMYSYLESSEEKGM